MMSKKTNFATTPIQRTNICPTIHQIGPSNANLSSIQSAIDGLSLCCLAATDGKATIITYNNTHLFQKPIPVWDPDYTTTFTTRFRPIPLIDDYNPTYIDPDYGRDPYWDTEFYNHDLFQFQYVLDDIDHYNKTVHENPPITHNKKTRALIENWQMIDGTNHPVFPNPLGTENPETTAESIPQLLLDEKQFQNVLIAKDGEPDCIPLSTTINLKCKKRMLYFPMDFGELTIDGLIDTGALSSAIPEMDLQKIRLLSPQSVIREGPPANFQIMVANGQLETPKSTIELKFEVSDIEFHEIFIVMEHLTGPIIGLMFLQRNHTVLDMRQGILHFPFFSMQLKTADHKYSNVLEPILNPTEITIPPNDRVQLGPIPYCILRMRLLGFCNRATFYMKKATSHFAQPWSL